MNSNLRLQTSDSEHEHEQERCIRASSFLRHSSFVLRHSPVLYCCVRAAETSHRQGPEVYPSRQARYFEVTGLTNVAILTIHVRRRPTPDPLAGQAHRAKTEPIHQKIPTQQKCFLALTRADRRDKFRQSSR